MKLQDSELSALYDGELEPHEGRAALATALRSSEACADWHAYALIGDCLRDEGRTTDIAAAVMARLQEEPVVLAPNTLKLDNRRHPLWALAASVAGVGVVGWLAFTGVPSEIQVASVSPASTIVLATHQSVAPVKPMSSETLGSRRDMQEYLLAHHAQAASFRLGDNVDHVRSVAMTDTAQRP